MTPGSEFSPSNQWRPPFECTNCGQAYALQSICYACPDCGGIFDFIEELVYAPLKVDSQGFRNITRYRASFPLPPGAPVVQLGEGHTPLVGSTIDGRMVYFKCEYLNPTGSFKDRGSAVLVSALAALGVTRAVEDSSGNAGASFAAYAARAGIQARIYIPEYASGPKRAQIEAYGAQVIAVPGPRSAAARAVQKAAAQGEVYASHAHLPHGLAGMATIAFELVEQLGCAPAAVVTPAGQGTLLLGMDKGFRAMREAGVIEHNPRYIAVQAQACAPLWGGYNSGSLSPGPVPEGQTVAEGIRIPEPLRGEVILRTIERSGGCVLAVDEQAILAGRDALSRLGLYVEPTSAVVWTALKSILGEVADPVVTILTGTGLKAP